MKDYALDIIKAVYEDISDRKGIGNELDGIDDDILAGMLRNWYLDIRNILDEPQLEPPLDILKLVRGY